MRYIQQLILLDTDQWRTENFPQGGGGKISDLFFARSATNFRVTSPTLRVAKSVYLSTILPKFVKFHQLRGGYYPPPPKRTQGWGVISPFPLFTPLILRQLISIADKSIPVRSKENNYDEMPSAPSNDCLFGPVRTVHSQE